MSGFMYDDSAQKGAMRQTQQGLRTQQFEGKRARQDIADALPSEMAANTAGVNRALEIGARTTPEEFRTLNEGNINAQQTIIDGGNAAVAALRGQSFDKPIAPTQMTYDTSFAQQQLPSSITNPNYLNSIKAVDPINPFLDDYYTTEMLRRRNEEKRRY